MWSFIPSEGRGCEESPFISQRCMWEQLRFSKSTQGQGPVGNECTHFPLKQSYPSPLLGRLLWIYSISWTVGFSQGTQQCLIWPKGNLIKMKFSAAIVKSIMSCLHSWCNSRTSLSDCRYYVTLFSLCGLKEGSFGSVCFDKYAFDFYKLSVSYIFLFPYKKWICELGTGQST